MANQEQLDILKQGVQEWNKWRVKNSDVQIDLSRSDLRGVNVSYAELRDANLSYAHLGSANLSRANLCVILRNAKLINANLSYADLSSAILTGADLGLTELNGTDLSHVHLSGANLGYTVFGDVDLSTVKGLERVYYRGPSVIGIGTIYRSHGKIPETFLREAGVPDSFINYMRSLVGNHIDYYSCFISYSSKDEALAKRLYANLQSNHVRCWFAPEDLKIGDRIRTGIDEAFTISSCSFFPSPQ